MAASSSSLARNNERYNYEVFISFRGSDVRHGFLSHLRHALEAEQIHAFIDNDLERGKDITQNLFQIIEQSDLSIVIFSQNYPKSEWCLEELEKIHESMEQRKQIVIPVFYQVDPADVQDLIGNYAITLQKWRDALVKISYISGYTSRNSINEARLVKYIAADVTMKLRGICPTISCEEGLFGIDSSIKDIMSLLCLDSTNDVRMVGIWGMGGIGKTTLASKVFDKIKKNFYSCCFVANVRETLSARDGLVSSRDKIICELLKSKEIVINSPFLVDDSLCRRLKRIRVLLVLDDVHTCMQLKSLLGGSGLSHPDSFCPGSRIIVTSRDSQVLRDVIFESVIYEAKQLKDNEALHLLSWNAFGQMEPQPGYEKISKEVLRYAHGVPLALVVLGSQLKGKPTIYWEATLKKIVSISPLEIHKILRISFDGLDREEKNIFLDIACFWKGESKAQVECDLEALGYHASIGMDRLIDTSLLILKIEKKFYGEVEIVTMHDLVQQMGLEIIAEQKERHGQPSRLWEFDDIKDALTSYRGTENVEAIKSGHHYDGEGEGEIEISSEAFIHMRKLRFLYLGNPNIKYPMGLDFLPKSIKYLRWDYYPLNYLPTNYMADKLVVLMMDHSKLEEINWSKPKMNLRRMDLSFSYNLIKISDLAMAPNLEQLNLSGCKKLVEVGSSLENLKKLTSLDVRNCGSLSHLPELPCSIQELILEGSGLRGLPSTTGRLTLLRYLWLSNCTRLESLPSSFCGLSSLTLIRLSGCRNLQELPEDIGKLESLKVLNACDSGLRELSLSIRNLKNLTDLNLSGCNYLTKLPEDIGNLESLKELDASCSGLRELPVSIPNLRKLRKLDLTNCQDLTELPVDIGKLEYLEVLCASHSGLRELPPSFQHLRSLIKLELRGCQNLTKLPDDIGNMVSLKELYASGSGLIELPQFIQNQNNLKKFKIHSLDVIKLPVLGIWVPNRSSNASVTRCERIQTSNPKP